MRITAFIGAALLCLGMMALAPVAMADPLPDICMLDTAQSSTVANAIASTAPVCSFDVLTVQPVAVLSRGGDEDEAAGPSAHPVLIALDFASYRQHFDPGRALA